MKLPNLIRTIASALIRNQFANEAELREAVDLATQQGIIDGSEREMVQSVFDLGDTLVRELMVPVITDNLDEVIGIAYVKDLARRTHERHESEQTEKVEQHIRKATFVPETKTALELLKDMQRNQIHMAIVVDEYGGTAGLITIEDILEEIVGEIADEYDDSQEEVEWLSDGRARISARLNVDDFAEAFKILLGDQEREDVDSVGGLIAKSLGRVPIPGSTSSIAGIKLTAERPVGRRHRIATVLAERIVDDQELVREQ